MNMSNKVCSDIEWELVSLLKEAKATGLRNDRVKTCYLGLRAAIADLYCDEGQYSRVLDRYVHLRLALDDQLEISLRELFNSSIKLRRLFSVATEEDKIWKMESDATPRFAPTQATHLSN